MVFIILFLNVVTTPERVASIKGTMAHKTVCVHEENSKRLNIYEVEGFLSKLYVVMEQI